MFPEEELRRTTQPGILDSLRGMVATLVQLVHARVELFTTELEEEMHRVAMLLLWAVIAVFFGGLFVLMLSMTIIIAVWDEHRLLAAIIMTSVFLAIVLVAAALLASNLRARTRLLATSLSELRRDGQALARNDAERGP